MMRFLAGCVVMVSLSTVAFALPKEACEKEFKKYCPDKLPTKISIKECLEGHRSQLSADCAKEYDAAKSAIDSATAKKDPHAPKEDKKKAAQDALNAKKTEAKGKWNAAKKKMEDGNKDSLKGTKQDLKDLMK